MKRFLSITLAFCISIAGLSVPAAQAEDYSIPCSDGGSVAISGTVLGAATDDCAGDVVIPAAVTETSYPGLRYRSEVTSVTFEPDSMLTRIASHTFDGTSITAITLPSNLQFIGYAAFSSTLLTSISFPSSVTVIVGEALANSTIESVVIEPREGPLYFDSSIFRDTPLQVITFKSTGQIDSSPFTPEKTGHNFRFWSSTSDGPEVSYPLTADASQDITIYPNWAPFLIQEFDCSLGGTFTTTDTFVTSSSSCTGEARVPSFVTEIRAAFNGSPISKIFIPAGVTKIGPTAFYGSLIETVEFETGSTLESIQYGAFSECKNLTDFSLPASVFYVSDEVFADSGLEHFTVEGYRAYWWFANSWVGKAPLATVTLNAVTGSIVSPGTLKRLGNTFDGWSISDGGDVIEFPYSVGDLTEITLYSSWTPSSFAVTYDSRGGTDVDPSQIVGGEITSPPAPPTREGYTFDRWMDGPWPWSNPVSFPYTATQDGAITIYAKWSEVVSTEYNVTFDTLGGYWTDLANVGGSPVVTFENGQSVFGTGPFNAVRDGYTFAGWSDTEGGSAISFPYYPGVEQDITLYALWTSDVTNRTVTFDSKGGSVVEAASFLDGGEVESAPEEPTRDGYTFAGWSNSEDGEAIAFPYTPDVTADITLYALWIEDVIYRTVTFDSKGGSDVEESSFAEGGDIESAPEEPTRDGYTFAAWSATDGGSAVSFPHTPGVTEDITLYAKWTANRYVVTYNSKGGSAVSAGSFVTDGQIEAARTAPKRTGFVFAGWSAADGGAAVSFPYSPGVIRNVTLFAKWTATYSVTYMTTGGSAVVASLFTNGGQIASAPASPKRTGFTFGGWSATNGGAVIKFPYAPGVSRNISLYAKWVTTKVKAEASVKPTVTGKAKVKSILAANKGTWKGSPAPTIAYQWYVCTKAVAQAQAAIPGTCKVIAGKTTASLTVAAGFKRQFLAVRVTGTSAGTTPTIWLSKSTGAVS